MPSIHAMTESAVARKSRVPAVSTPDGVGQAAQHAQHDAGQGQDHDERQVVPAQGEGGRR